METAKGREGEGRKEVHTCRGLGKRGRKGVKERRGQAGMQVCGKGSRGAGRRRGRRGNRRKQAGVQRVKVTPASTCYALPRLIGPS